MSDISSGEVSWKFEKMLKEYKKTYKKETNINKMFTEFGKYYNEK